MGAVIESIHRSPASEAVDVITDEKFLVPQSFFWFYLRLSLNQSKPSATSVQTQTDCVPANSILEVFDSVQHGSAEVIERDCSSFMFVDDQSGTGDRRPAAVASSRCRWERPGTAGLELYLRFQANAFLVSPLFGSIVAEQGSGKPWVHTFGKAPCRNLSKADCRDARAVWVKRYSCRLSFIHGWS